MSKEEITLDWLPSEIRRYSPEELLNGLDDAGRLSFYFIEASSMARKLNNDPPRSPSKHECLGDYLNYLESLGFHVKMMHENFYATMEFIKAEEINHKKMAEEFMHRYEEDHPFISEELFNEYVNIDTLEYIIDYAINHSRRLKARRAASKKLNEDPKQHAKQQVRECWDDWKKKPSLYKSKSAFARDMLDKFPSHKDEKGRQAGLGSQRVIERWCKEWESEPS